MKHEPSKDSVVALESLRRAVAKALERKRLLGRTANRCICVDDLTSRGRCRKSLLTTGLIKFNHLCLGTGTGRCGRLQGKESSSTLKCSDFLGRGGPMCPPRFVGG